MALFKIKNKKPCPRYKIGELVWFLNCNKVEAKKIVGVFQERTGEIYYSITDIEVKGNLQPYHFSPEQNFFTSKEALLQSL